METYAPNEETRLNPRRTEGCPLSPVTQLCPTLCGPMDCSLPEKEFRAMIVKTIQEVRKRMDAWSNKFYIFNKELEKIKNNQS